MQVASMESKEISDFGSDKAEYRDKPKFKHLRRGKIVPAAATWERKQPRERLHITDRFKHKVQFDKEAILAAANNHDSYRVNRSILKNLPKYDDCSSYGVSAEEAHGLLQSEVEKIIRFASEDNPPLFDSHGVLTGSSCADFDSVSGLADQLICNLSIITLDNSRHGVTFGGKVVSEDAWMDLNMSRAHLRSRYATDDMHIEGKQPMHLPDADQNEVAYHYLLDYILSTIAWCIVRCADGLYWKAQILAVLAQWAVKLKVVSTNPVMCAEKSLAETSATVHRLKMRAEYEDGYIKIGGKEKEVEAGSNFGNIYCEEKMYFREKLHAIFDNVLASFIRQDRSGTPADMFQLCVMLYRRDTDAENIPKVFNGHRHGNLSVSSDLRHLNDCYSICKLLQANIDRIRSLLIKAPPNTPTSTHYIRLSGAVNDDGKVTPLNLDVSSMDYVISLMVPMILMTPDMSARINDLKNLAKAFMEDEQVLRQFRPPSETFAIECTLATDLWNKRPEADLGNIHFDPDIQSLAESPLRRGVTKDETLPASSPCDREVQKLRESYSDNVEKMQTWQIRTHDITLQCRSYVRVIQSLAIILVLGGLAVPFSAGDRIPGVDPFQIATYTWLLAGFFLIAAKSFYVENWPWNDFLHGRVECKSITELSEVSRIDPQVILLFLLRNEWNTLLTTDGPYNGMFKNRVQTGDSDKSKNTRVAAEGFSIDESLQTYTMLASGIVPLKVRDHTGEHLICIDGRKGGWDGARARTKGNWMTCKNFNAEDLDDTTQVTGGRPADRHRLHDVHRLERVGFKWTKVLGVYVKDSRFG